MIWCILCFTLLPIYIFKWYLHLYWQVMNHVWFTFDILNKWIRDYIVGIKNSGWIINFIFCVITTKNLLVFFLLKRKQFLKFNSSINLSFIVSPRNELSMYIQDFNCSWSTKSSHSMNAIFTFLFICSKLISSLVFVIYGGDSSCLDGDVHPFTYSFILSTRILLLHLRIPISSSSLLLSLISSFTVSAWLFLLHLGLLISSSSLLLRLYSQHYFFFTLTHHNIFLFATACFTP